MDKLDFHYGRRNDGLGFSSINQILVIASDFVTPPAGTHPQLYLFALLMIFFLETLHSDSRPYQVGAEHQKDYHGHEARRGR